MGDENAQYLSAEELRNRLYHSLRNRGLIDTIKSQLRNSLVTELQQTVRGPLTLKDLKEPEGGSLLHRASNSLVANHLRACGYEYTLSVFLPECGLDHDKKFEISDLIKLLNISPNSRLHQKLATQTSPDAKKGFLWQLLSEISSLHSNSCNTTSCQTDLIKVGPITPLDEKLSDVDRFYSSQKDDFLRSGRAGAEERLLSFQHQLEERYNTQLKMELARMRDAEIATFKMSEKEKSRKELEQARRDLERTYRDKHEALVQRERNAMERLQQQTDIQERETFAQRQSILEEIEAVRQREIEVKREAEVNKKEKKLSEDRVKDKANDLRRRELEISQRETSFEQKLQNEMAQFKLDQQARYIDRIQNVEVREAKTKEEERIVSEEKARLGEIKNDLRDKTHRVNELETMFQEARHKEVNATKNNEFLNAKLRDMSDYSTLKEQVILYRNELETLRTRLAEVLSMNERERGRQEELLRELRRPSPESLMLQRDLERAKESLRQEQIVFKQQNEVLEHRLKEEMDRNKDLFGRFEEQTLQMREMNRELVDLRQQLHMTNKALSNEVYRQPRNENQGESPDEGSQAHRRPVTFDPADECPSTFKNRGPMDIYDDDYDDNVAIRSSRPQTAMFSFGDDETSSIDSADVIAHTKYRLKNLDKEAHNLERAYSDFHHRLTNVDALPLDPPAPSPSKKVTPSDIPDKRREVDLAKSPQHSPIPFENPMSSTPYRHKQKLSTELEDSFAELGTQSKKNTSLPFNLSAVKDDDQSQQQRQEAERHEKMRSITMDDLEQRPGSPGIVIVADSGTNSDFNPMYGKKVDARTEYTSESSSHKPVASEPAATLSSAQPGHVPSKLTSVIPSISPQVPAVDSFSLDSAWKKQIEEEREAEEAASRRQREMEEQLKRHEEEQKETERFERLRERQREEEELAEKEKLKAEKREKEEDEKIDPVMKQYMAMVQQQKEKEKELAKKTVETWSRGASLDKTPSHSEDDLSAAGVDKSEQDGDDGFSW